MSETNEKTSIWDQVQETDPNYTKQFNRGGGFRGTSTNATYLARRATEIFGPMGIGWGIEVVEESYIEGGIIADTEQRTIIHVVRIKLWYHTTLSATGERGEITQFGQTTFVGSNKHGIFTDEEAPKKSLTDAMTKCLSLLGFSADIFLGLYDDNKYVADLERKYNGEGDGKPADKPAPRSDNTDPDAIADDKTHKKIWREGAILYAPDPNAKDINWGVVEEGLTGIFDGLGISIGRLRQKQLQNAEVGRVLQALEVARTGGRR